ncbi:MAG: hypothetical protein K0S65_6673 [Labilithrix sp.]|nr:hypothetical protein [Labilithrix sp.]
MRAAVPLALPSGLVALALLGAVATATPAPAALAAPAGAPDAGAPPNAGAAEIARLDAEARAPALDVRLAPSSAGVLGAWLVAGPFKASGPALDAAPVGIDEKRLAPSLNAVVGGERDLGQGKRRPAAKWKLVSSGPPLLGSGPTQDPGSEGSRTIDLKASLEDAGGSDMVAYAAGRLHIEQAGRHYLLLGVDDGVRVSVDGAVVFSRDDARPVRDDDDVIALDLAAGDHDVVLKLHQRDGAWAFRAKLVDRAFAPPLGAYLMLPGTTADDARTLAARMSWLVVDRAFDARGPTPRYRPVLTVRYPEGAPRGVPIAIGAKLSGVPEASSFDVRPAGVAVTAAGVADLMIALPPVDPWPAGGSATLESTVAGRVVKSTIASRVGEVHRAWRRRRGGADRGGARARPVGSEPRTRRRPVRRTHGDDAPCARDAVRRSSERARTLRAAVIQTR